MARRNYSDRERAEALAALDANGGELRKTSRQVGVPLSTLDEWAKGKTSADVPELRTEKKRDLADRLEEIALQLADAIPAKMETAALRDVAVSLGIALDKMRLLRGEPTTINEELTPEARKARIAELIAKRTNGAESNGVDTAGRNGATETT